MTQLRSTWLSLLSLMSCYLDDDLLHGAFDIEEPAPMAAPKSHKTVRGCSLPRASSSEDGMAWHSTPLRPRRSGGGRVLLVLHENPRK